jgi:hypothetical protein
MLTARSKALRQALHLNRVDLIHPEQVRRLLLSAWEPFEFNNDGAL